LGTSPAGRFKKDLGFYSILTMSLGTVIGSGWLLLPSVVASYAGPASIFSWVFAGLIMLVVAVVYAELGAAWPAPGAVAEYPYLSHGSFTGHLSGWAAFISYAIIPPAEAVAVTRYAGTALPALVTPDSHLTGAGMGLAIAILALLGLINYVGVKYLGIFQSWVTSLKYIPIILFVIIVGLFAFHPENLSAFGGFAPHGTSGFMLGTAATVFALLGFRQALDFGAEAKNPGRDLPLALILTLVIAMVTYALVSLVFVGGIDWSALGAHGVKNGGWASLQSLPAPVYNVTVAAGFGVLAWLIFADGLVSPNGPNITNVGSVPRVAYTMANNGSMPGVFLRLHPRFGTPGPGLLLAFFLEIIFLLISAGGYGELISIISVAFMVAFVMGPCSFTVLRHIAPDLPRPFRLKAGRLLAPLAFVLASLLLFWSKWPLTGETLAILFIGVLIYIGYGLKGTVKLGSIRYGYWIVAYLFAMALISYLGDTHFGGIDVLPFGWDILAVVVVALILYFWGVRQGIAFDRELGSDVNHPRSGQSSA
jgi:amino acid transporter